MSLISLQTSTGVTLATDQRVFAPEDVRELQRATDLAQQLDEALASAEDRVAAAESAARESALQQGREQGYAEGLEQARDELAANMLQQEGAFQKERDAMRAQTTALALEIVRRIAGEVAPAEWLSAQAERAAEDLIEQAPLSLRVHPSQVAAVTAELAGKQTVFAQVSADDSVTEDACIVESRVGRVDASLGSQLQCLAELDLAGHALVDTPLVTSGRD